MDDSLYCLGIDSYGRWGNGSNTYINTSVATPVDPGETYLDISVTRRSVCGVTSSNKMKCWGTFKDGNLGTGDSLDHFSPTPIDSAESYAAIRSGGEYACGLTLIGEIKCWGYSMTSGGTFTTILQPQTISAPLEVFTQLSVAPTFACAIRSDSRVLCWGSNSSGRLGTGNSTPSDIPVLTADTDAYSSITTGNDSSCGVTTANVTKCWGSIFGWAIYNYPAVYPSPTNSFMANADNFSSYSNYLVGIASDGSLSWAYRNSRLPGFTGATRYFEHVQGLVDR
ncbi:MAG: hypothetical protein KDD35_12150 [Bdellovibrionales bacterium]|nr:hypothetical protein [Bdellovibrionales bacterium]